MLNMAFIVIAVSCFLISSLISEAKSQNFVTVACPKSKIVAQYGTSTLLECVVQTNESNTKIESVSWTLNKTPIFFFNEERIQYKAPNFQLALGSHWDGSNMNVSLLITNTNLSHAGNYVCSVLADDGKAEANVHLEVKSNYSKPMIYSDPKKIIPDKDFTLTCEAHGGFPKGDIRWVINGKDWMKNPAVEFIQTPNGLYDLTSKLSFGPDSLFTEFVCEVYNAKGVKESQGTFYKTSMDQIAGSATKGHPVIQVVAPVVVIGSLIVGLLVAILLCRRKQQRNLPVYSEENDQMV